MLLSSLAFLLLFGTLGLVTSCKKESASSPTVAPPVTPVQGDSLLAPMGFGFQTTKTVNIDVNLAAGDNTPIAGIPVNIYDGDPATTSPILTSVSDNQGRIQAQVNVPAYIDTLTIDPSYVGLIRNAKALVNNSNSVTGTIGGPNGYSGSIVESAAVTAAHLSRLNASRSFMPRAATSGGTTYTYMGDYDNSGVPKYLIARSDNISATLLSDLNASLPERANEPVVHPEYLSSSATSDINIMQTAEVSLTFVSEGAGYLNALGYYTYPTATPPQSAADIKNVNIIFPNASLPGSGGNLKSGSKVKLGVFKGGTSIGFVLFSNGWNGSVVNTGTEKFYSTTSCNPEASASLKRHTVLLYDASADVYLTGFEDMNRQNPSCDHDFNDVVFYTTANPESAISNYNVQDTKETKDSDGDGVPDYLDAYPNDPIRAYNNYYPSATTFANVAFEDLWPATGDYDMNDMVVGYRYKIVTNAKNQAVEIYSDYMIQASGASYISGFGVQFPFSPSLVKSVTGQKFTASYIKQSGNGTEAGQSKAVIIPFDNYNALIKRPGGYYINTQNGAPYIKSDTAHVYMQFTAPLSASTLGNAPFNPFLISNQRRGYEVHLPNNAPTDLVDKTLFGTLQDNSNPAQGRYYVSKKNWPWALDFTGPFNYPAEGVNIGKAYNYFLPWAQSGGTQYTNWYLNTSGNINPGTIYTH